MLKKSHKRRDWSNNIVGRALSWHMSDLCLIPGTLYCPPTGAKSYPWMQSQKLSPEHHLLGSQNQKKMSPKNCYWNFCVKNLITRRKNEKKKVSLHDNLESITGSQTTLNNVNDFQRVMVLCVNLWKSYESQNCFGV